MSKNILILSSSPRLGGNSDTLCNEFMRGAIEGKNQVEKINKKERYTGFFLTKISKNPCVTAFFVLFLNLTSNEKGNEKEKKIET